jgi:hypothetical protein
MMDDQSVRVDSWNGLFKTIPRPLGIIQMDAAQNISSSSRSGHTHGTMNNQITLLIPVNPSTEFNDLFYILTGRREKIKLRLRDFSVIDIRKLQTEFRANDGPKPTRVGLPITSDGDQTLHSRGSTWGFKPSRSFPFRADLYIHGPLHALTIYLTQVLERGSNHPVNIEKTSCGLLKLTQSRMFVPRKVRQLHR